MTITQTFAAADATLKALAEARAALAALLARPASAPEGLAARLAEVEALLLASRAALAPIGEQEDALRGLERALILANDDSELAARDKRLRSFASERTRIEVLIDELTQHRAALQRQIEVETARPGLMRIYADYHDRVAKLAGFAEVAQRFEELLEIASLARGDRGHLWLRRKEFPEIGELDIPYDNIVTTPHDVVRRLAKFYTDLVEPPPRMGRVF